MRYSFTYIGNHLQVHRKVKCPRRRLRAIRDTGCAAYGIWLGHYVGHRTAERAWSVAAVVRKWGNGETGKRGEREVDRGTKLGGKDVVAIFETRIRVKSRVGTYSSTNTEPMASESVDVRFLLTKSGALVAAASTSSVRKCFGSRS